MKLRTSISVMLAICMLSCQDQGQDTNALLNLLSAEQTGIDFNNELTVNDSMNYFKYGYFYMGGGTAAGDLNGDGLPEIFFTSNMENDRLYLNKGNLNFEDITKSSGIPSSDKWHTGCSFGDINDDGKLDILVSVSGIWNSTNNLIYINQGNNKDGIPLFKESAKSLGLDDSGQSIQMAQLDYDMDGDLDLFVLNYPITSLDSKTPKYIQLVSNPTHATSDHLYRNNGDGSFTDVTEEAGLVKFGLGIGVVCSDLNLDGLTDIYVSNDFQTPDFFFVNNGDGTFTESLYESFQQTSFFGMGVDIGDINNDFLPDLIQVDMTTNDNYRSKANMASMDIPGFEMMVNSDLGYQYMYNSLQLNNGIANNNLPAFSNIAMSSKVSSTDWSWASLLADFDQDGFQDLFISNGTRKDINNKDYFKWLKQTDTRMKVKYKELDVHDLTDKMPSMKISNYIFKNEGATFNDVTKTWGIDHPGFSNGASYADLDADGDLDLIINNIDEIAHIYENSASTSSNFLSVKLRQEGKNPFAIGARVYAYFAENKSYRAQNLVRGYQSSVDPILHFGLGNTEIIDSLIIIWPDNSQSMLRDIPSNQVLELQKEKMQKTDKALDFKNLNIVGSDKIFQEVSLLDKPFHHKENKFNDFDREVLLPHKMSSFGPALAIGDVDKNGHQDFYVGGAKDVAGQIFYANENGFTSKQLGEASHEDVDAKFVDVNGDSYLDLIIASGGNEIDQLSDNYYNQRYYLNDGKGNFSPPFYFPTSTNMSASKVFSVDQQDDGKNEVFLCGRQIPGKYPQAASSVMLDEFSDEFSTVNTGLSETFKNIGMITDAHWFDYDKDGDVDILLIGEWSGIRLFLNKTDRFEEEKIAGLSDQIGWWQDIEAADFDNDGDLDFVVSNLGTNYKYQADDENTFDIYSNDFDKDKDLEIVLSYYQDEDQYPVRGKQCSSEQMPDLIDKYPNYHSFASSKLSDIYGDENLKESLHLRANNFKHTYIENQNGKLVSRSMPMEFQRFAINVFKTKDVNQDGYKDLVFAGNIFDSEAETPRSDGLYGGVALNDGKGNFKLIPNYESGLHIPYETRALEFTEHLGSTYLIVGNNDAPIQFFKINQ